MPNSGTYCYGGHFHGGSPEWQTILPDGGHEIGQKTFFPNLPDNDPLNHYVTWQELVGLMQDYPDRALEIVAFQGRPSILIYNSETIPWIPSIVEGIVTNSFLSGGDFVRSHNPEDPPDSYWLGPTDPYHPEGCGTFDAKNAICDDWIVYVKPEPEYHFLLARDPQDDGNFDTEHQGSLECEIEQWLIPTQYRPEPGDRIMMTGRWVIDSGPGDWHGELHPIESFVSSHAQTRAGVLGGTEIIASVVLTGANDPGTYELDIWPPARPSITAKLRYSQDQPGAIYGLTVQEQLLPEESQLGSFPQTSATTTFI